MLCKASVDLMSLRLDGLLEKSKLYELDDHIKSCRDCLTVWAGMLEADTMLRLEAKAAMAPPPDFVAKVMVKVAATPVARPALWDRVRVEGGRRTMPLATGRRVTLPLGAAPALPALASRATPPPSGMRGTLGLLQNRWVQAYVGGLSAAAALAVVMLVTVATLLVVGGTQVTAAVNNTPVAPMLGPAVAGAHDGLIALGHIVTAWLVSIDWLLAGAVGLALAGVAALWVYLVRSFLRRDERGGIEA
jgi:hypothetical protein